MNNNLTNCSIKKALLLLTILITLSSCSQGEGRENWKKLGENAVGTHFYDKSSIKSVEPGMVTVRLKQIFSQHAAELSVKALPHLAGVYQSVDLDVIDCANNRYFLSRIIYYDKHGKVLHDSGEDKKVYTSLGYRPIPKDTVIDRLSQVVCRIGNNS